MKKAVQGQPPKPEVKETVVESLPIEESRNIIFKPNEGPQTAFLAANEREVLYGGSATALVNAHTIGTTAGRQYPTTTAGGALAWEDIGTSDQRINFTNSAATNAGEVRITITYQQNNNLA